MFDLDNKWNVDLFIGLFYLISFFVLFVVYEELVVLLNYFFYVLKIIIIDYYLDK